MISTGPVILGVLQPIIYRRIYRFWKEAVIRSRMVLNELCIKMGVNKSINAAYNMHKNRRFQFSYQNGSPTEVTNIEVVRMLVTSNQLPRSATNIDVAIFNIKLLHFGQRPIYSAFLMMNVFFNGNVERPMEPYF